MLTALFSTLAATVVLRDVRVGLRIPHLVVQPVQDAGELVLVQVQRVAESEAQFGVAYLPGVMRRYGRDEVRVQDRAAHEVDRVPVERVAHPVGRAEVVGPIQAGGAQDSGSRRALVAEVVDGVADALMGEPGAGVDLVEQHRHQRGLPVVRVNHVGALVALQHELERRLAEEREALRVVPEAVVGAAVEVALRRVRLDEEALAAVHEPEPDSARDRPAIPRHPQVVIDDMQVPDLVVAHAVVLRQDDLDRVAADLQFAAQAEHHVRQTADLGHWRALGGDHDDIHRRRAPSRTAGAIDPPTLAEKG